MLFNYVFNYIKIEEELVFNTIYCFRKIILIKKIIKLNYNLHWNNLKV